MKAVVFSLVLAVAAAGPLYAQTVTAVPTTPTSLPTTVVMTATNVPAGAKVTFMFNGQIIGNVKAPPYAHPIAQVPAGSYAYGIVVTTTTSSVTIDAPQPLVIAQPGWTFAATPSSVQVGQSTTLAFKTTSANVHSVYINNLRPTYTCSVSSCAGSLVVAPAATVTYQLKSKDSSGKLWPVLSTSVTVTPKDPPPTDPTTEPPTDTSSLLALPLLTQSNLQYEGAFKLPGRDGTGRIATTSDGRTNYYSFRYGGSGIGYNPARNSLFASGEDSFLLAGEVGIPEIRMATTMDGLVTGPVVQTLTDPTDGRFSLAYPGGLTWERGRWGSFLPYKDKLLISVYNFYDQAWAQTASHFVSGLDLKVSGDVRGPYKLGGRTLEGFLSEKQMLEAEAAGARYTTTGFTSGYMGHIPVQWQTALNGKVLAGNCCVSIIGRTSYGPAAFAFDPDKLTSDIVPVPLVYYPIDYQALGPWGGTVAPAARMPASTLFNGTTDVDGVVFPDNTRTVIFIGRHGLGDFCYGVTCLPQECGMTVCSQANHAPPYVYYAWLYDAADFLKVRAGTIKPWQVRPYEVFTLNLPYAYGGRFLGGAAWDPATRRIFISQDQDSQQVIHVYRVP